MFIVVVTTSVSNHYYKQAKMCRLLILALGFSENTTFKLREVRPFM